MNKVTKRLISVLLAALMLMTVLAGCGKDSVSSSESTTPATTQATGSAEPVKAAPPEEVTLEYLAPSPVTSVNDMDLILEEFYKQTKDTLNTKINFTFTTFDNIGQKVSLKIAAGEQLDAAFAAQWTNPAISTMSSKEQLVELDKYFTDEQNYPGLKKAFTQDYLKNNSYPNSKGEYHVFGLPFGHSLTGPAAVYYRQDLAEKYGVDIKTYEDLTKFYDAVLSNEKGMVPFSFGGAVDRLDKSVSRIATPILVKHNTVEINNVSVIIRADGTPYAATTFTPALDPEYNKINAESGNPAGPNNDAYFPQTFAKEWYTKGYVEKDILSQKDPESQFVAGRAASYYAGIDTYINIRNKITAVPGAKLGYFAVEPGLRANTPKSLGSNFMVWNYVVVPKTSQNVDRTMQFFNWIFSSQKNHDLFELGIEGKHWTSVGDTKYSLPEGVDPAKNYNFPGYVMTWVPTMQRYSSDTPDDIVTIMNNLSDTNYLYKAIDAGFAFNAEAVKAETAKVSDAITLMRSVGNGITKDAQADMNSIEKKVQAAGFAKIREEVLKQFGEFLKTNPYQGQ